MRREAKMPLSKNSTDNLIGASNICFDAQFFLEQIRAIAYLQSNLPRALSPEAPDIISKKIDLLKGSMQQATDHIENVLNRSKKSR